MWRMTGEFVCNIVTWDTREQMNQTSATLDKGVDEMALVGLTPTPSRACLSRLEWLKLPVHLECKTHQQHRDTALGRRRSVRTRFG